KNFIGWHLGGIVLRIARVAGWRCSADVLTPPAARVTSRRKKSAGAFTGPAAFPRHLERLGRCALPRLDAHLQVSPCPSRRRRTRDRECDPRAPSAKRTRGGAARSRKAPC